MRLPCCVAGIFVALLIHTVGNPARGEDAPFADDIDAILSEKPASRDVTSAPPLLEQASTLTDFSDLPALMRHRNALRREAEEEHRRLRKLFRISTALIRNCADANVTAFQIESEDAEPDLANNDPQRGVVYGYRVKKQLTPDPAQLKKVRLIITDLDSYKTAMPNCFEPGMIFQFREGSNTTTVFICTFCGLAYIYDETKMRRMPLTRAACFALEDVYEALFHSK